MACMLLKLLCCSLHASEAAVSLPPCHCVAHREYSAAEEQQQQALNGTSCYCLTRGLLPHMIAAGGGAVVGISSVMSLLGSMAGEPGR
jgi:NAD(P)-dependent dehydrogenase (short-subunit alcohol dehydrogenase family)